MTPNRALTAWQAVPVRACRHLAAVALAASLVLGVAGCQGDEAGSTESPEDRLAEAKRSFDDAEYIDFTLSTDTLPTGLEGLLSAEGTGTHDPAFDGEVKVQTNLDVTAPLIAVNDTVYIKLPFSDWSTIDPAGYGAPDPAQLMDPEQGISSLFTATDNLQAGDPQRDGETVVTPLDGTIPGAAVKKVFPSSGTDDFDVTYRLTDDNAIDGIDITGPFYEGSPDVTYSISLDLNGDELVIEAPI